MFRQFLTFAATALIAQSVAAQQGALETPRTGTTISGKAIFSGWHCDANSITIAIDGNEPLLAAYGTTRGDTAGKCGDSDNGWGLLFNMAELGDGEHTVVAYADGEQFATSTFNVTKLSTGNFLSGKSATTTVADFPKPGHSITLA